MYQRTFRGRYQLKRSILKVQIPRNTRILEIAATLPDAKAAQAFALYLAQQAVKLSSGAVGETESDLVANAEKVSEEARTRMENAERAWVEVENTPVDRTATRPETVLWLRTDGFRKSGSALETEASV